MELKSSDNITTKYHDIFDYKLTKDEAVRWQYGNQKIKISKAWPTSLVKDRIQREKYSKNKFIIAKKASKLISKIPTVKFIGITGALAMNNANKNSDIDLMIITSQNKLWTTRLISYLVTWLIGIKTRKPNNKTEKDRLCLNMWLDESDLIWDRKDRNIYTAHEIAQVVPLINIDKTYEKFLYLNKWILGYWPNAVKIKNEELRFSSAMNEQAALIKVKNLKQGPNILEIIVFKLQYLYMKSKITREIITPTKAIFHPKDWSESILKKLST